MGNIWRGAAMLFHPEGGLFEQLGNFDGNREFNLDLDELTAKIKIKGTEYKYICKDVTTTEDYRVNGTSLYQVVLKDCKFKNLDTGKSVILDDDHQNTYTFEHNSNLNNTDIVANNIFNSNRLASGSALDSVHIINPTQAVIQE